MQPVKRKTGELQTLRGQLAAEEVLGAKALAALVGHGETLNGLRDAISRRTREAQHLGQALQSHNNAYQAALAEIEGRDTRLSLWETIDERSSIIVVEAREKARIAWSDPAGVAVVMPSIDPVKALEAARILLKRAGMPTKIFIVQDTERQGFIKTLNAAAALLDTRYIVYLAEDVFAGEDWLKLAFEELENTGKSLLAFNCGKWHGRIAAFGMIRKSWVQDLYGGDLLFAQYKSHRADNELTVLARVMDQFVYLPTAVLMELDANKVFRRHESEASNFTLDDKHLFIARFNAAFGGLVAQADLEPLRNEYLK